MVQNVIDYVGDNDEMEVDEHSFKEYDITSAPNDFNIKTIFDFIESGVLEIPGFQRNYVWDRKRASKLIESIIMGLPIPQIFLYETGRNKYLVIDGQQRLMSIYYFMKGRFPKKEYRSQLRTVFNINGKIPDETLSDTDLFGGFKLDLQDKSKIHGLFYSELGDYKQIFDLRTIRNVIIKQNFPPPEDDPAIYEIFNRLNTGGIKLSPQEIRTSLYHSDFYQLIEKLNYLKKWRSMLRLPEPEMHMKDLEIILRGFALLIENDAYQPSMTKFLNTFSKHAKKFPKEKIDFLESIFNSFMTACQDLNEEAFFTRSNKFNILLFESVFAVVCRPLLQEEAKSIKNINPSDLELLKNDIEFIKTTQSKTSEKSNVLVRLNKAKAYLLK